MPQKRLTQEQFIEKCVAVHGDTYDYTKSQYVLSAKKIIITCKVHGDFEQTPYSHIRGNGCYQCGRMDHRVSQSDFIKRCKEIHGDKYDYSKAIYNTYYAPITLICDIHVEFTMKPCNKRLRMCKMRASKTS